jgi:hypothetical protein
MFIRELGLLIEDSMHLPVAFNVWPGCRVTIWPEEGSNTVLKISEGSPITASSGGTIAAEATTAVAAMAQVNARMVISCLRSTETD